MAMEMRVQLFLNDISNLVLNDYNMITCVITNYKMAMYFYFKCKSRHIFGHNLTPCDVELFEQVVRHDYNDHNHLMQYDYKSNCRHNFFFY